MRLRVAALALVVALVFPACTPRMPQAVQDGSSGGLHVMAVESFLADIARNVAGQRLQIDTLLPLGADPHSYQPAPQDAARLSKADLLILNGAGLESFLQPLLENISGRTALVEASAGLKSRSAAAEDPHFWLDPQMVEIYVQNIREGLTRLDPAGSQVYASNAAAYIQQLQSLDAWIQEQVAQIPAPRRLLVTNHEAFGYFADRYGFTVIGAVIPSLSTDAAPSARQLAALIDQIKAQGVKAVFLEKGANPQLADQIASETGAQVVTDLYLETLSAADGPAPSYLAMMKYDVTKIVEALK